MSGMVELANVTMQFKTSHGTLTAIEDVSFNVADGEFISLIGPSGCGKSTILRLISDIYQPIKGTLSVAGLSASEARKRNLITMMFQEPILLPWLSIIKNVNMPLELIHQKEHLSPIEALEIVGLKGREHDYPYQLSGGMQQRAALARSLVTNPRVLLMDEPFAAIDELTRDRMGQWLLSIWEQTRKTVIFVTHSIPEALFLSDRVIVLDANPGSVRADVTVDLPRPRTEEIRQDLQYFELLGTLRSHLRATQEREVSGS